MRQNRRRDQTDAGLGRRRRAPSTRPRSPRSPAPCPSPSRVGSASTSRSAGCAAPISTWPRVICRPARRSSQPRGGRIVDDLGQDAVRFSPGDQWCALARSDLWRVPVRVSGRENLFIAPHSPGRTSMEAIPTMWWWTSGVATPFPPSSASRGGPALVRRDHRLPGPSSIESPGGSRASTATAVSAVDRPDRPS